MSLINWKSGQFKVLDATAPFADGGAAINDNFKQLCSTAIFTSTADPTTSDNDQSPTNFAVGSLWLNTASQAVKILVAINPTTHNATWVNVNAGTGGVPSTRSISTTAPLTGGGDLSADRTLAISASSASAAGSMSAAHFSLVNGATDAATANALVKRDASGNASFVNVNVSGTLFHSGATLTLPSSTDTLVSRNATETLKNKTLCSNVVAVTPSGTPATAATDANAGNHFVVTLSAATTTLSNPSNSTDGQKVTWELIQNSGNNFLTFGTNFAFGSDIPSVTLSTISGKRDFLGAIYSASLGKWCVVSFAKGY